MGIRKVRNGTFFNGVFNIEKREKRRRPALKSEFKRSAYRRNAKMKADVNTHILLAPAQSLRLIVYVRKFNVNPNRMHKHTQMRERERQTSDTQNPQRMGCGKYSEATIIVCRWLGAFSAQTTFPAPKTTIPTLQRIQIQTTKQHITHNSHPESLLNTKTRRQANRTNAFAPLSNNRCKFDPIYHRPQSRITDRMNARIFWDTQKNIVSSSQHWLGIIVYAPGRQVVAWRA